MALNQETNQQHVEPEAFCKMLIAPRPLRRSHMKQRNLQALHDDQANVTFVIPEEELDHYLAERSNVAMN